MKSAFVAYRRVSSSKQGVSGLGLAAQEAAITRHVSPDGEILASYTEVESGRMNARPQLALALAACKRHCATLVVANLSRLSRNLVFLAQMLESGVSFVAADMPNADRMMLGFMAVLAEHESRQVSQRTRAAMQAAKAKGVVLGRRPGFRLTAEQRTALNAPRIAARVANAQRLAPILATVVGTLADKAKALNEQGHKTPRGRAWSPTQVRRLLLAA